VPPHRRVHDHLPDATATTCGSWSTPTATSSATITTYRPPEKVLSRVLGRTGPDRLAAHQVIEGSPRDITSLAQLGAVFEDAARSATDQWLHQTLTARGLGAAAEDPQWPSLISRAREVALGRPDPQPSSTKRSRCARSVTPAPPPLSCTGGSGSSAQPPHHVHGDRSPGSRRRTGRLGPRLPASRPLPRPSPPRPRRPRRPDPRRTRRPPASRSRQPATLRPQRPRTRPATPARHSRRSWRTDRRDCCFRGWDPPALSSSGSSDSNAQRLTATGDAQPPTPWRPDAKSPSNCRDGAVPGSGPRSSGSLGNRCIGQHPSTRLPAICP
jgi:hypothetical protein